MIENKLKILLKYARYLFLGAVVVVLAGVQWVFTGGKANEESKLPAIKNTVFLRIDMPTTALTAWQLAIGGLPIVVAALALDGGRWGPVSLGPGLAVAYNMGVSFVFCYWAWFRILAEVPVARCPTRYGAGVLSDGSLPWGVRFEVSRSRRPLRRCLLVRRIRDCSNRTKN